MIEQQRTDRLYKIIADNRDAYVGKTGYEELARRFITRLGDGGRLPFIPEQIGRIWNKKIEIDVAAIEKRSGNILLGECKWSARKFGEAELDALISKARRLPKIQGFRTTFALFSKAGFTAKLVKRASRDRVLLYRGAEFERV